MREAVIVASSRTPLAKSFRGSFNLTRPDDLAAHCITRRAAEGAATRPGRDRGRRSSAAAIPQGTQGDNVARVAAIRAGLPVTVAGHDREPLLLVRAAGHRAGGPRDHARRGRGRRSAAASRASRRPRNVKRDPNPWVQGAQARHLHGHGRHGRGRRQAVQDQPRGAGRIRALEPAAHGAGPAGGLLQGRDRADAGRRAASSTSRPARSSARKSTRSTRTSATAPTRRSKGCARSSRTSTRRAARGRSRPATRRNSPTARRPRC